MYLRCLYWRHSANGFKKFLEGTQVESLKPDPVIDIVLQSCHTYNVEAVKVESCVREDLGTNYLKVVTDFSRQDLGQLKTRIAAALEMN